MVCIQGKIKLTFGPTYMILFLLFSTSTCCTGYELHQNRHQKPTDEGIDQSLHRNLNPSRQLSSQMKSHIVTFETSQTRRQTIIKFNSIRAREIATILPSRSPSMHHDDDKRRVTGVLRELSDGSTYIVSSYDEGRRLIRCRITEGHDVDNFIESIDFLTAFSFKANDSACSDASENNIQHHLVVIDNASKRENSCVNFNDPTKLSQSTQRLLDIEAARNVCLKHLQQDKESSTIPQSARNSSSHHDFNNDVGVSSDDSGRRIRHRRNLLIYPGTLWCGAGSQAASVYALGDHAFTDRCCRAHDLACPDDMQIGRLATKYHLYNNAQPFTLSHCACDKRFHKCLRQVRNSVSFRVGDLYFNVLDTQCFVLRPRRQCVQKTWWGKCEKYEKRPTAVLRRARPFPTTLERSRKRKKINGTLTDS